MTDQIKEALLPCRICKRNPGEPRLDATDHGWHGYDHFVRISCGCGIQIHEPVILVTDTNIESAKKKVSESWNILHALTHTEQPEIEGLSDALNAIDNYGHCKPWNDDRSYSGAEIAYLNALPVITEAARRELARSHGGDLPKVAQTL